LGVADHLTEGPRSVEELAEATGTHAPSLYRALRALACKEIFTEVEPGKFALTPMAEFLRADHPLSLKDAYPLIPADVEAWAHLDYSVRTGMPAFDYAHSKDYWDYMKEHPEEAARFDRAQQAQTRLELRVFLRAYDWNIFRTLVDVGGGNGAFLGGLLARHPALQGILVDQPQVVARAPEVLASLGVQDRCQVIAGDFFRELPPNADAYILKRILYGWHNEDAVKLLRAIRSVMRADSRLLIIEPVDEPGGTTDIASRYDLAMLVMKGSGARPPEHISALFGEARLRLASITRTLMFPVIEAEPVS
jgi:SAM-dependent methyltransferase